jgi:tRNA nucleotidyltransferase/poly(A) polymerase
MQTEITLNDVEREIVDTLMAATEQHGIFTTLRCAGGWVRDQLLGRDSKDIDIALDDVSGKGFAARVRSYQGAKVCSTARSPCHASFGISQLTSSKGNSFLNSSCLRTFVYSIAVRAAREIG